MIQLKQSPKVYTALTERSKTPEETLKAIEEFIPLAGITRVADITNLDRIGVPVYSCIRPTAADGAISVYNGKGGTVVEAKVAGIMEGIERYSAEAIPRDLMGYTYDQLYLSNEPTLDPKTLILPKTTDPKMELPWFDAWDIVENTPIKVPLGAVIHPNPHYLPSLFRSNSNGIASGNTLEEAVFYALTEVIERDSWSIVEATRRTGKKITDLSGPAKEMLDKFTNAGVEITLKDITSDLGVPTIAAVADDVELKDPRLLTMGIGTHTNPEVAVIRALTEVAQSRATQIHGAREDATTAQFREMMGYDRVKRMNAYWFASDETISYEEIKGCSTNDFLTDIQEIISRLKSAGLEKVIVADLTDPEIEVPVVRVIVPGLECFTIDNERKGKRCIDAERSRISRAKSSQN